jgi:hypothetical protein
MSLRTVLLWDAGGVSSLHYLGPSKDIVVVPLSSAPEDEIALISDGNVFIYSKDFNIGLIQTYRYHSSIFYMLKEWLTQGS